MPWDIAVTKSGDLVYTDYADHTVNIVKGKNIDVQELIRLQQWKPVSVFFPSSGDLLLIMDSDDNKQTKVLRYSDYKENQSIQFNEKGQPLYSSDGNIKYIGIQYNRNRDICVSDCAAHSVVVVNKSGSMRFIYPQDGYSTTEQIFNPYGITTNSQGRILTADYNNDRIHILDQDGQFLRYIDNCDIKNPWGLCLDTKGNLIVAQNKSSKIKKISYSKPK
uniref:Tripartite motif-containing protein 2 n=1 Tax=Magallana gigas TaxID=29159 RepID=K1QPG5_MAGGI